MEVGRGVPLQILSTLLKNGSQENNGNPIDMEILLSAQINKAIASNAVAITAMNENLGANIDIRV